MHAGGCCQGSADRWGAERPNRLGVASVKRGDLMCSVFSARGSVGLQTGPEEGVKETLEARG